jgi:hypothetical protein
MSLHRYAAKRDENEPGIRARFAHHGWHTEALSAQGMPDLLCFPPQSRVTTAVVCLVDVKTPKGGFKPAQVKKWTALHAKGIPVYIARTAEDVDAIVAGTAEAWAPRTLASVEADAVKPLRVVREAGAGSKRVRRKVSFNDAMDALVPARRNYAPPRSKPVDAAKEAEETFAPASLAPVVHSRRLNGFCACGAGPEEGC